MESLPKTIILMGVSGSGKSLVGGILAASLGAVFEDADDYHPPSNKAKMSTGIPLTDEDRWPWYQILRERIETMRGQTACYILACSALKKVYREKLRAGDPTSVLKFVYLHGSRELIGQRLSTRKGHFMPSTLLDSQFATLEEPEDAVVVDVAGTPERIVREIVAKLALPSDKSDSSDRSDSSEHPAPFLLPKHGGYRKLRSFQTAQIVHDGTLIFCNRFIDRRSRTHDQMVQAARSGVQNIAEGSVASGTSKKTELKLTNVARSSLEELLLDYEDYLRQHGLAQWPKDSTKAVQVRHHFEMLDPTAPPEADPYGIAKAVPETAANTLICLTSQASFLLGRQIRRLEQDFLKNGGFTERLHTVRSQVRAAEAGSQPLAKASPAPICPLCQKPMVERTACQGPNAGQSFWGCSGYPDCKGTRPI